MRAAAFSRIPVLCLCVFALAANASDATPTAPQGYVDETRVSVPKRVGTLSLIATEYDPERRLAGATFRYRDEARAGATFTVIVHPAGDQSTAKAIKDELPNIEAGLGDSAVRAGYRDFAIAKRSSASVDLPPRAARGSARVSVDKGEVRSIAVTPSSRKPEAAVPQKPLKGRRLLATYLVPEAEGRPASQVSKYVYLFNRHMYFIRATATYPAPPDASLQAHADRLVQSVVSGIGIENIGRCGALSAYVNENAANLGDILKVIGEISRRNCVASANDAELRASDDDAQVTALPYRPGDWSAE